MAKAHLQKQLSDLMRNPIAGFKVEPADGNLFKWDVWLLGPKGTPYEKGTFHAQLSFTEEFPMKPPEMRFISEFWHPNVYPNGTVCISILHPPGTDEYNTAETAQMRWTPVQSLEKVLLSVISMIADPDPAESGAPANVDALVEWRKNNPEYVKRVLKLVDKANQQLPADFEPPLTEDKRPQAAPEAVAPLYEDDDYDMDEDEEDSQPADGGQYSEELAQLRAMGIPNEDQHLETLVKCKGNLERALDLLAQE
ncbi:Ubiquitin-conjugating enzyme E2 15 [Diplonema papillatum]|nr:Ubiquitin-conjugating enzyme E2 15 [Diplonema papillatum]